MLQAVNDGIRVPARSLARLREIRPGTAGVAVVLTMVGAWLLAQHLGPTVRSARHLFYVPILLSAAAFGHVGAAVVALVGMLLAGPLAAPYPEFSEGPASWLGRGAIFVAVGQFAAVLFRRIAAQEREIRLHVAPLHQISERRWQRTSEVMAALSAGGPSIVFQPIVDLESGTLCGVESLARFPFQPNQGPARWFEQAWDVGLGTELELAALRRAVEAGEDLPPGLFQSVNLSPAAIMSEAFVEMAPQLPCERLILEITEHAHVEDYGRLVRVLSGLRARGVRVAIDDVGAGFATLRHVLSLSPELIKLDLSLCRNIHADPARVSLAQGLSGCAEHLGASVVAEGIEGPEDLAALRAIGVLYGQGFYLGRPQEPRALFPQAASA